MRLKEFFFLAILIIYPVDLIFAAEKSEKEIKIGVFLEDLKDIGKFERIKKVPEGLFPDNLKNFHARATKSQSEVGRIFVQQKGLLEKYPDRLMLGMAYFEITGENKNHYLSKLTHFDLRPKKFPVSTMAQTLIARIDCSIYHLEDKYLVTCHSSFEDYFKDRLQDAINL